MAEGKGSKLESEGGQAEDERQLNQEQYDICYNYWEMCIMDTIIAFDSHKKHTLASVETQEGEIICEERINHKRHHAALVYLSPAAYEEELYAKKQDQAA